MGERERSPTSKNCASQATTFCGCGEFNPPKCNGGSLFGKASLVIKAIPVPGRARTQSHVKNCTPQATTFCGCGEFNPPNCNGESLFGKASLTIKALPINYVLHRRFYSCKLLNRRLYELTKEENHWKVLCRKYWLETSCPVGRTWEEHFIHWFKDMGSYINCYVHIKKNWEKITSYFKVNCPLIHDTIKAGTSEEELDAVEENLGLGKLPTDLRCSYRIHNGQRLTSPGIMGSMSIPGHYRSESLLDLATILVGFREREGLKGCIPLTLCLHSGLTQYLAVTDDDGYDPNTIFYPIQSEPMQGERDTDAFISGTSFLDWLTIHANHLANDEYVLMQDQPFRFLHESSAEETTDLITVSVSTAFLPEISKISPPKFYHTYRITMTMSPEAPQSEACQLETRHWIITDDNGSEEQVDGPGVVGEYPVMYPGANFSWVSSTSFSTTYGNMKGYFRMRNLQTSERSKVLCPIFHMKCLPYITAEEREATKARKRTSKAPVL